MSEILSSMEQQEEQTEVEETKVRLFKTGNFNVTVSSQHCARLKL